MNMLAEEKKNLKIDITAEAAAKRKREIESEIAKIRKKLRDFQEPVTQLIESEFRKIGYSVKYNLLNAADYGVPQKRQRVIFIGSKNERDIKFPQPTHMKNPPSNYTLDGKKLKKWVPVSSILFDKESGDVERYFHSQRMIDGFRRREKIHKKFGNGFGWQILRPDEPSFTISARYWKDGSDALVKYSDDEIRMLTERECARIQSFPDTFEFAGSKRDVYTQIGNAVPPLLAKAVAKEIMKSLAK
jgi:DNA (cytosine-5)-methyltransferase 1